MRYASSGRILDDVTSQDWKSSSELQRSINERQRHSFVSSPLTLSDNP